MLISTILGICGWLIVPVLILAGIVIDIRDYINRPPKATDEEVRELDREMRRAGIQVKGWDYSESWGPQRITRHLKGDA